MAATNRREIRRSVTPGIPTSDEGDSQDDPEPTHRIRIAAFQGDFDLEELDSDAERCRVNSSRCGTVVGSTVEVVAAATELDTNDPWVVAVARALTRERGWRAWGSGWGRRGQLEVLTGHGEMYHVTATVNRESIHRHGLDWRYMGDTTGVAGSSKPELPGIFLQEDLDDDFFVRMARFPTDIWCVDVEGLWVESGPSGWWIVSEPIAPERLELARLHPAEDVGPSVDLGLVARAFVKEAPGENWMIEDSNPEMRLTRTWFRNDPSEALYEVLESVWTCGAVRGTVERGPTGGDFRALVLIGEAPDAAAAQLIARSACPGEDTPYAGFGVAMGRLFGVVVARPLVRGHPVLDSHMVLEPALLSALRLPAPG